MNKLLCLSLLMACAVAFESGCATKKYVRSRVAERVTPLENRTGELEETSRRSTQQIGELKVGVEDVRARTEKAQSTADNALSSAEAANKRVTGVERNLEDLRANLDKYSIQTTSMVFFRPSSAVLTKEAMAQLDHLASQIIDRRGFVLEIVGYGDSDKETRFNQNLAQLRAEAVQRYLADRNNVPLMRMFAAGFGVGRPLVQNASTTQAAGQSMARRVEVHLLTNAGGQGAPIKTASSVSGTRPVRNP